MKRTQSLILVAAIVLMAALLATGPCLAQPPETQAPATKAEKAQTMVIKGKIGFMKNLGGYYLQGEEPQHEFMIQNQNPAVLKKIMKRNKTVTVEAHATMEADRLVIDKINGKKYRGK